MRILRRLPILVVPPAAYMAWNADEKELRVYVPGVLTSPITFTFMVLTFPTDIARKVCGSDESRSEYIVENCAYAAFGLLDVHPLLILPIPGL